MTDIHDDDTTQPPTTTAQPTPMNGRMMWVMLIGCCLAIPLALIIGGVTAGGLAGASPWLLGVAALLAVALLIVRRIPTARGSDASCDHRD